MWCKAHNLVLDPQVSGLDNNYLDEPIYYWQAFVTVKKNQILINNSPSNTVSLLNFKSHLMDINSFLILELINGVTYSAVFGD